MGILAIPLGYLLQLLYRLVGNYGICLIIVTIVVKAALYPVYAKQIKSSMQMTVLQPRINEIQQKYARDKEKMNEKIMELYKEEHVSMSGGCLPMIVQMLVIMGLFALLRNPMNYIDSDEILLAIHESFLWIRDLAQPDKWILPILAGVATYISYAFTQRNQGDAANANPMKGMTLIMKYFFPVMILLMARSYPAGLAIYWSGSQIIQILYNVRFAQMRKKMLEEDKKKAKAKERAKARAKAKKSAAGA